MKRILLVLTALATLLAGGEALAWELNFPGDLAQGQFKNLSKELGSAIAYRNLAPAEPLGITGFDVAVQGSFIRVKDDSGYWKAAAGDVPSYIGFPTLRVRKGLPFGIDVGAMYAQVLDSNVKLYGVEVSKALLEGGIASPALGVRGTYTRLAGVDDLRLQTAGIDASISKGFLFLTPYAGAGMVWIDSEFKGQYSISSPGKVGPAATGVTAHLSEEKIWQPRGFVGVKISPLPLVGITAEVEYATRPIYSLKAGVSF
jgi:hypothetical protein